MVSVQFCVDSAYQSPRSFLSTAYALTILFPFQSSPTREQIRIMLRAPVRSANRDKSLGEAPRYTHLEFPVQKRITPNQNSAWLSSTYKAIRTASRTSPLSCILSRQPARTTLRCAPSPTLRFGPPGVRSGTQPTERVAKGKMTNCRVLRALRKFRKIHAPQITLKPTSFLYTRSFALHL